MRHAAPRLVEMVEGEEMKLPNSREREVMQHLRGAGWVKGTGLPDRPRIIANLIARGWVEYQQTESGPKYRLTEPGLQAMKAPLTIPGRDPSRV
jgi:hypothetical protein